MPVPCLFFFNTFQMFQFDKLETRLLPMVALEQNIDSDGWQLATDLTTGAIPINGFHPMLTFENIKAIATDFDSISSIVDKGEAFSAWCEKRLKASLKKMVNEWRALKLKELSARTLIERERLFRPQIVLDESSFMDDFVGHELVSTDSLSLAHKLERIGIQLSENQEITIYLFRDGEASPIKNTTVNYTGNRGVQWERVDWILSDGGKYFIGYDANLLSGFAINGVQYADHLESGQGWKVGNHFSVMAFHAPVVTYEPGGIGEMEIENSFVIGGAEDESSIVWNAETLNYTTSDNFGLNLEITSFCDYTSLIVGQADSFAYAFGLRAAIDFLREMLHNPNSAINRNADNAVAQRQLLIYEIDGEPSGRATGLQKDYMNAINGVMFDDSGVDSVCLPCRKKGIKFKVQG